MYYRLTYISSPDRTKIGDNVLNGSKPLTIGQTAACDVQLPESTHYEPYVYASVLPLGGDGSSPSEWFLARRSDCHDISINGKEVGIAQKLKNGDTLSFSVDGTPTEMKFEVLDDGDYDSRSGLVYLKHKGHKSFLVVALVMAVLAFGSAAYAIFASPRKDLRHEDLSGLCRWIYHITTDSVYLLCDTIVDGRRTLTAVDAIELDMAAEGTAFLTSDSLFVTARHCIEPWINDEEWDGVDKKSMSPEMRLATKAETENRKAGYEKYILSAHCVISKGFERHDFRSTDFHMNKSRDMVLRLGPAEAPVYWRSIIPIARRRDMELGDFAYIKAAGVEERDGVSPIVMAEWDDIEALARAGSHDIAVIGYPLNDNGVEDASRVDGSLMQFGDELMKREGCLRISAGINPGNSGGPVFAKIGDDIKVIGIVSKADGLASQGMFWAVPITEVVEMHRNADMAELDSATYRR